MKILFSRLLILAALLVAAAPSIAQEFPARAIRIICPASAGTVTDVMARLFASQLNTRLGWTVLVENRAGGDFFPSTLALTQSPADGLTVYRHNHGSPCGVALGGHEFSDRC